MKSKKLFLMAKKHNHWLERGLTLDHKDFFLGCQLCYWWNSFLSSGLHGVLVIIVLTHLPQDCCAAFFWSSLHWLNFIFFGLACIFNYPLLLHPWLNFFFFFWVLHLFIFGWYLYWVYPFCTSWYFIHQWNCYLSKKILFLTFTPFEVFILWIFLYLFIISMRSFYLVQDRCLRTSVVMSLLIPFASGSPNVSHFSSFFSYSIFLIHLETVWNIQSLDDGGCVVLLCRLFHTWNFLYKQEFRGV